MRGDLRAHTVTLQADGEPDIECYAATPLDAGPFGSVVVLHHMPGYDDATREITRRIAVEGFVALCPNLYSREVALGATDGGLGAIRAMGGLPNDRMLSDLQRTLAFARSLGESNGKVAVLGFCSGGRQSIVAASMLALDAAVDCYGGYVINDPDPERGLANMHSVAELVADLGCPLLGIFGSDDAHPSTDEVAQLEQLLTQRAKPYEFHTFADAGHAFMAADRPSYRPEPAQQAWTLIFDFLRRHVGA